MLGLPVKILKVFTPLSNQYLHALSLNLSGLIANENYEVMGLLLLLIVGLVVSVSDY